MQHTETKNEGLKREYSVVIEASEISKKTDEQLKAIAKDVKIAGFRPGHAPLSLLKQKYGKSVIGEVIEKSIANTSQEILDKNNLKPALQPKVEITEYKEGGDLSYKMEVEVLPEVPELDFSKISIEKLVCDVEAKEIDETIERFADNNKSYTRCDAGAKAETGNQVVIDFVGKVNGEAFAGGSANMFKLVLGSGSFIAGFEDQLIGKKEGDKVTVKVTFPKDYHKADLAGVPAEFDVEIHEINKGFKEEANDEFAQKFGFETLEKLREAITAQFTGDYENAARVKVKKQLFDKLDELLKFEVPQGMFEHEFNSIWKQLEEAKKQGDQVAAGKSDDELRAEYTKIANRRVKLGILLSDLALKNNVQITQSELSSAIMQQARQFPGQEKIVFDHYKNHPEQLAELRGPILEEKVVDFIIGKVTIQTRKVAKEELLKDEDEVSEKSEEATKPAKKKKAANA